jgi:acyl-coenzyme A thioesterase PaaI-like protein
MSEPLPVREVVHLRAHLGVRLVRVGEDAVRGELNLSTRTKTSDGRLSLGALATIVDVGAMFAARVAQNEEAAHVTTHLALRVPESPEGRRLYVDSEVVRAGRATIVSPTTTATSSGSPPSRRARCGARAGATSRTSAAPRATSTTRPRCRATVRPSTSS